MLSDHRRYAKRYIREAMQKRRCGYGLRFVQLARYYPEWLSSITGTTSPVSDRKPWITFPATEFLGRYLRDDMRVFEYGIGGSTLFFLDRVQSVVSVEHDAEWMENLASDLTDEEMSRWICHLIQPEEIPVSGPQGSLFDRIDYRSDDQEYSGRAFRKYASAIDDYPDGSFDLIMIDGRARPSCFVHAVRKVKERGYIFWDNTERENYHETMNAAPSFLEMIDFPGPSPYVDFFTRTTAWKSSG